METWREILNHLIEDPKEKRRIANAIGISSMRTLDRWADSSATPKNNQFIRKLAEEDARLNEELRKAFPQAFTISLSQNHHPGELPTVPIEFYSRVLHAYTSISPLVKHWTITNLVMEMILSFDSSSIAIVFAQCMAESEGTDTISYLLARETGGRGHWDTRQLAQGQCRWGSDTLIGAAAADRRPYILQEAPPRKEVECFVRSDQIQSLAAYPVQREGAIAGILLVCASEQDFFTLHRRTTLSELTRLYSLAYSDSDFYTSIALARLGSVLNKKENSVIP